jgi:hypothetical protein
MPTSLARRLLQSNGRERQFVDLAICRQACEKALRAIATYYPDVLIGDFEMRLGALIAQTPTRASAVPLEGLLGAMSHLRAEIEETFQRASVEAEEGTPAEGVLVAGFDRIPLKLVLDACPALSEHLSAPISTMEDIILAGKFMRNVIGAQLSDWHGVAVLLGQLRAAILVLYVFQMISDDVTFGAHRIKNPVGLFQSLATRLANGGFDLGRELDKLRRRHMN